MWDDKLKRHRDTLKNLNDPLNRNLSSTAIKDDGKGKKLDRYIKNAKSNVKAKLQTAKKELANELFQGNRHAVMLSELRKETQEMEELLQKATSEVLVKARGGAMIPLREFAYKQAFGLGQCSKKAIYQHNTQTDKFTFKHMMRCGRRSCPVCSHFASLREGEQILDELQNTFGAMKKDELKNGRLFLLTFTHENVPLDRVFDIAKAWRHTQQMKKRQYKKKDNPYSIWNVLKWGIWRWEVTRNEKTGLWHPHIHVMAFVNDWLAPEEGGYWNRLVESWKDACALQGLNVGWKGQNAKPILYFKKERGNDPKALPYNFTKEQLAEVVEGAVAEMSKYAVKSTEFTKIKNHKNGETTEEIANELAMLFSMMAGRKIKNGFGGFSLHDADEDGADQQEELVLEDEEGEHLIEVVYSWDNRQKRYVMQARRPWNKQRFADYLCDMRCYKDRHTLMLYYGLEREAA